MKTVSPERAAAIAHYVRTHWGYNPVTGEVTGRGGKPIGKLRPDGALDCLAYLADGTKASVLLHRAAWLLATGEWPIDEIDHDDRNRANNRWGNLRTATHGQNRQNLARRNAKGRLIGATPYYRKWKGTIRVDGVTLYLGLFETEIEAHEAYCAKKRELHTFNPEQKPDEAQLW